MFAPRLLASAALAVGACSPQRAPEPAAGPEDRGAVALASPPGSPGAAPAPAAPRAPAAVISPTSAGIVALAPGVHHACGLRDGQVFCWGFNRGGLLGVGEPGLEEVLGPRRVPGLERIVQVVADYDYTCALNDAHAVYCWGDNDRGQLGTGGTDRRSAPTLIAGLNADRLIAGYGRACAAVGAGFRCWGSGELGDGVERHRQGVPLEIAALAGVDDLTLSDGHACSLEAGEVRCWGHNASGQLGNGEGGCRYEREPCPHSRCLPPEQCKHELLPVRAVGLPPIVELHAGGSFTFARDASGKIWRTGQQGVTMDFGADNPNYRPQVIGGLAAMVELGAGASHACARTAAGELWCWGNNAFGQLGHPPGPRGGREAPSRVEGLRDVTALAVSSYSTCALTGAGEGRRAWCWGDNGRGQLGDGTTERRHTPVPVQWPAAGE